MDGARIFGLSLIGLTALLILRQYKPEWASFLRIAVAVLALGGILSMAGTVMSYVTELMGVTGADTGETWQILLRALGVAFLSEIAASVCRDSGEGGLAGWVEMAGRLEILLLSFPLIRTVLDTVLTLLGDAS